MSWIGFAWYVRREFEKGARTNRRPSGAGGSKLERRKESRFPASIRGEVSWECAEGAPMEHEGVVRHVNEMGTP